LRDVATDQQTNGTTLELKINRDTASRYGIQPQLIDDTLYDAFGQRQVTQYFTQLNSYHVILEVLPELQGNLDTLNKIYIKSPTTGDQVPLSTFATWTSVPVRPLSISHQGQFPAMRSASASPRAWRWGKRLRRLSAPWSNSAPLHAQQQLPGYRAGVPAIAQHRAAADHGGAGRGLPDPRHSL
jgi:multidrug efflux pump subunit AcrB